MSDFFRGLIVFFDLATEKLAILSRLLLPDLCFSRFLDLLAAFKNARCSFFQAYPLLTAYKLRKQFLL